MFPDLKPTNVSKIESVPGKIGTSTGNIDEFDLLAQSRTTDGSSSGSALKKDTADVITKETEFDEMAAWLKNNVRTFFLIDQEVVTLFMCVCFVERGGSS